MRSMGNSCLHFPPAVTTRTMEDLSLWQRNRNDFVLWQLSACLGILCARLLWKMHLRHQTQRVNPNPALQYLKMQVVACAVAGMAYITYNLLCRYRFTCGNGSLRHVGVPRCPALPKTSTSPKWHDI